MDHSAPSLCVGDIAKGLPTQNIRHFLFGLRAKALSWLGSFRAEAIGRSCWPGSRYAVETEATKWIQVRAPSAEAVWIFELRLLNISAVLHPPQCLLSHEIGILRATSSDLSHCAILVDVARQTCNDCYRSRWGQRSYATIRWLIAHCHYLASRSGPSMPDHQITTEVQSLSAQPGRHIESLSGLPQKG